MRIGATADLHYFAPKFGVIQEQLAQVRDQADLLVVAGDLTNYGKPPEMEQLLNSLVRLRLPIVAVLGNHDYESGLQSELIRMMTDAGIETGVHYPLAAHRQPVFAGLGIDPGSLPVSERLQHEVLSLPIGPHLTDEQVDHVVDRIRAFDA